MNLVKCPSTVELQAMLRGEVSNRRLDELADHLAECPDCSRLVAEIPEDEELRKAFGRKLDVDPNDDVVRRVVEKARSIFNTGFADVGNDTLRSALDETTAAESPPESFQFLSAPQLPDEIGRLGKYRILDVLGQGGMGVVFRAHDPSLNRNVALKVLWMGRPVSSEIRQRFAREAKALAAIEHDNVVPVYSVEEDQNTPFLTMKLLKGESLSDILVAESSLDQITVVRLGRQLASALAAAHSKGVIHRDVKPGNIWIEPSGKALLIDFGLARTNEMDLTTTGHVMGTPRYMSPEQANGQPATAQSDLFSLGTVLYRCLSGKPPFGGDSIPRTLRDITDGNHEDVTDVCPTVDPELADVIRHLLQVDPDLRLKTASELESRLAAIEERLCAVDDSTVPFVNVVPQRKPVKARTNIRKPLLIGGVLAAFLVVLAAVVIKIQLSSGDTVMLTINDGDKPVEVDVRQDRLTIMDPNDGKSIQIEVDGERHVMRIVKDGFSPVAKEFDLTAADGRSLHVQLLPNQPEDGTETHNNKSQGNATSGGEPPDPARVARYQREIGQWVLSKGGSVEVHQDTPGGGYRATTIGPRTPLPSERFRLHGIIFKDWPQDPDPLFRDGRELVYLFILTVEHGTISEDALKGIGSLTGLHFLVFKNTSVASGGLRHLTNLAYLEKLKFISSPVSAEGLVHLASIPRLKHLSISSQELSPAAFTALSGLRRVETLELFSVPVPDEGLAALVQMSGLKVLVLHDAQIAPSGLKEFQQASTLKRLDLRRNEALTADDILPLQKTLPECSISFTPRSSRDIASMILARGGSVVITPDYQDFVPADRIEDLPTGDFSLFKVDFSGNKYFRGWDLELLSQCDTLEIIHLNECQVVDSDLEILKSFPKLRVIQLSQTPITDAGLNHLRKLSNLTHLHLIGTAITNAGLARLVDCPALVALDVRHTNLDDEGLKFIAAMPHLEQLNVGHNRISDRGLENLSTATGLTDLQLDATQVSDAGLRYLESLINLKVLSLKNTVVTKGAVEQLHKKLPGCRILWNDGVVE